MLAPSSFRKKWSFVAFLPTLAFCLLLTGMAEVTLAATKQLLMNPSRIIFTEKQRSVNVHVANIGTEPITYTVSLITLRKDPNGKLVAVATETEGEKLTKSMVRFSPRRATIPPGTRQVVKLMVQKPADLPPGEYQTRLNLSPQQPTDRAPASSPAVPVDGKSNVKLDLIISSSFPVIIQHGVSAEVAPLSFALKENSKTPAGLAAEVKLTRSGTASAFGDLFLKFIPANNPQAIKTIGRSSELAFYLPETEQTVTVPLKDISRQELSAGTVRVEFEPYTGVEVRKRAQGGTKNFKDFPVR
jgi:P pilus assembly chaperone PapD